MTFSRPGGPGAQIRGTRARGFPPPKSRKTPQNPPKKGLQKDPKNGPKKGLKILPDFLQENAPVSTPPLCPPVPNTHPLMSYQASLPASQWFGKLGPPCHHLPATLRAAKHPPLPRTVSILRIPPPPPIRKDPLQTQGPPRNTPPYGSPQDRCWRPPPRPKRDPPGPRPSGHGAQYLTYPLRDTRTTQTTSRGPTSFKLTIHDENG